MKIKFWSIKVVLLFVLASLTFPLAALSQTEPQSREDSSLEEAVATPTPIVPEEEATTGINLTVSPNFLNLITDPGKEISSSIKVKNNNNVKEYLEIRLSRFESSASGDRPVLVDLDPDDPFPEWISFSQKQFILEPNETKTVKFAINPPEDAALGYYYALIIGRIKETGPEGGKAVVAGAPAISLLLEVKSPHAKRELQLVDFKPGQNIYEYLPAEFKIKVKNTGNIHAVPYGDIFIDWGNKTDIAILSANPSRGNILPQTERVFTSSWDDGFLIRVPKEGLKDKRGNRVYEIKWDFSKADRFRIGKYTANLLMVYDDGKRDIPMEATTSFWIVPWKLLLILITVIVLAGISLILIGLLLLILLLNLIGAKKASKKIRRKLRSVFIKRDRS
ncbi:hypothetical protein KKD61_01755 [Patescibacteria group bacterium]|nr:hypothetical protein [Patescibacteria group bacterium]